MSVPKPATTLSSDNRDESLRDIIANSGLSQDDLGALMTFCMKHIPTDDNDCHRRNAYHHHNGVDDKKIAFIEGINLVVMYVKMGLIILHEEFVSGFNLTYINYRTNDDGRIIMLHIDPNEEGIYEMSHNFEEDRYVPYDLSKDILRFQSLEDLTLSSCRSIPDEVDLSLLPHLKKLWFDEEFGETSTRSVPSGMNLPRLEELVVNIGRPQDDVPPDFVSWVTSQLLTNQLPNLQTLSFNRDGVLSNAIITNALPLPRTIHTVILSTFAYQATKNQEKRESLLKFLKVNTSVYNMMSDYGKDYHPDIKYALLINHAGESVVVENGGTTTHRNHIDRSSIVPSSVLPTLLERSYKQSDNIYHKRSPFRGTKDHTGMYYLLRHNINALPVPTPTVPRNGIYNAFTGMYNVLRHNIIALIGDASVTMDNRDANRKVSTRKNYSVNGHKRKRLKNNDKSPKKCVRIWSTPKNGKDYTRVLTPIIESYDSGTPLNVGSRGERRQRTNNHPDMVDPASQSYEEVADDDEPKDERPKNDDNSPKKCSQSSLQYSANCARPSIPLAESHPKNNDKSPNRRRATPKYCKNFARHSSPIIESHCYNTLKSPTSSLRKPRRLDFDNVKSQT